MIWETGYNPLEDEELTDYEKSTVQELPNGNLVCKHEGGGYMGLFVRGDISVTDFSDHVWLLFEEGETPIIDNLLEKVV